MFKTHYRPAEIKKKCIENPMQPAAIINVTTEKGTDASLPYSVYIINAVAEIIPIIIKIHAKTRTIIKKKKNYFKNF